MREVVVVAHNLRSTHNIGSLFRTAEGLGVKTLYLTGYTPYPQLMRDDRLPHLSKKLHNQIHKTALGAEETLNWNYEPDIQVLIKELRADQYQIVALEQSKEAILLPQYVPNDKVAIILGREVEGIEPEVIGLCDKTIEIPMFGHKESFNVVQSAAMALYHCTFYPF